MYIHTHNHAIFPLGLAATTYFHMTRLFNLAKWLTVTHFSPPLETERDRSSKCVFIPTLQFDFVLHKNKTIEMITYTMGEATGS